MRISLIFLFVVAATGIAWTQQDAFELNYHSLLEQQTWDALHLAGDFDPLALFIMVDPHADEESIRRSRKRLELVKAYFSKKYLSKITGPKQIRQLFNQIQNKYLSEFDEKVTFSEILKNGKYNCVTACAFYSMIFDELGIEHHIKLAPTHVFLEVKVAGQEVILETTDPLGGFIKKEKNFEQKLDKYSPLGKIGDESYGSNLYLEEAKSISLIALAGIQYYNQGVSYFEGREYSLALEFFRKSSLLYPNFRSEEGLRAVLMEQSLNSDFKDPFEVSHLVELAQLANDEITRTYLVKGFSRFSDRYLHENEDLVQFRKGYFNIFQHAANEETRIALQSFYFFEVGRYYFQRKNFDKSEKLFRRAHELTPNIEGIDKAWKNAKGRSNDLAGLSGN